ncbi:hypothetical protein H0H87_003646 [Tephrocybe sp. NHM501043]|nr:hypothetical protein H0H87_003646 [Tephrocybe sp. NHM501043]
MLVPEKLLDDQDYYEHHLRDLTLDSQLGRPVVVQFCGNDVQTIVQAGRKLQEYCDGIGMSRSFTVPTSVKIRLAQPIERTVDFAQLLEASGAAWVTLHARTVSARRRRQGAADLDQVKNLKNNLRIPVISNGNVREWSNIPENLEYTGADGVMVGETLLGNPWFVNIHSFQPLPLDPESCARGSPHSLFANKLPDPVDIALQYLDICRHFPDTASVQIIQTHIRHFVEFQWYVNKTFPCLSAHRPSFRTFFLINSGRRPWFQKFRSALSATKSLEDMDALLRTRVERWRGRPPRGWDGDNSDENSGTDSSSGDEDGLEGSWMAPST